MKHRFQPNKPTIEAYPNTPSNITELAQTTDHRVIEAESESVFTEQSEILMKETSNHETH